MASVDVTLTSLNESPPIKQASFTYVEDSQHDAMKDKLISFRRDESYTDLIIKTHHIEVSCHKVIIAAGSKYFDQLFKASPKESLPSTVELNEVSPDVMEAIIEFFYTAKITMTSDNVPNMYLACTVLKLDKLKNACDKFIADNIAPYNCLGMYVFAKANGLAATLKAAHECMMTRPHDILRLALETEYQTLSEDDLISYISNDDLGVEEESTVFEIVLKWVESDRPNREKAFENVLQHIRLPFCTSEFLCNVKEVCPYTKAEKCEALIWEAMKYHLMPASRHSMQGPRTCPRKHYQVDMPAKAGTLKDSTTQTPPSALVETRVEDNMQIVVMGGRSDDEKPNKNCWYLKEDGNTWEGFTEFPSNLTNSFRAVNIANYIIVTGGCTVENKKTGDCWSFNIHDKKWKSLPALQTPRGFHVMVCVGEDFYVCGGSNGCYLDTCEKLDSMRQNWTYIPSLLKPTTCLAGVVYNNAIYVIGGYGSPNLTQCYCATTNTWEKKADVPTACDSGPSAVVLHDIIYIVNGNNKFLSYNPRQDSWTTLTQPNKKHGYSQCLLWQGRIVVGGGGGKIVTEFTDRIEEYDPESNEWTEWKIKLPKPLRSHCMLIVPISGM